MRKLTTALAVVLVALMAVPSIGSAKDRENYSNKSGRFGLGYDSSLGGVGGLSARFQVAKNFGIQGIVGYGRTSIDTLDPNTSASTGTVTAQQVRFALRGDVAFAFTRQAVLGILFGANVYQDSFETSASGGSSTSESDTRFSFEAGLKSEYHFTDFFSVHGEVGFLFALVNRSTDADAIVAAANGGLANATGPGEKVDGSLIIFGLGEPFGSFGFTFWFK